MEPGKWRKRKYSTLRMVKMREIGRIFSNEACLTSNYYKHFKLSKALPETEEQLDEHGAIFNLEFSPNGKVLIAACEEKGILLVDPKTGLHIDRVLDAHSDCVNCISFCDDRIFASGSDDTTIALWDIRMLGNCISRLSGHTSWVKSLLYDKKSGCLVSAAYDGTVRAWNINAANQNTSTILLRNHESASCARLTPDGNTMVVSCPQGQFYDVIILIHHLDLLNFPESIQCSCEQTSDKTRPEGAQCEHHKHNFLEKLNKETDFPAKPMRIFSMAVHPEGTCFACRLIAQDDMEYTAIYDIRKCGKGKTGRLSHYIQESNSGEGFIKEQSFSHDGRILASPYAHGTRLLAFDSSCSAWMKHTNATLLRDVKLLLGHSSPVVCSKFSPCEMMLATGCLGGEILFHAPKL